MLNWINAQLGRWLAEFLSQPVRSYIPFSVSDPKRLARILQPGDILLVEGNLRISVAIKYLTQSTWSHAALYIGSALDQTNKDGEALCLIEADLRRGVIAVPLTEYANHNTRICRPIELTETDRNKLIQFVVDRIGLSYDLKNVVDLARYLFPTPPVPMRWRRRLLAFGSGDPTKAICSTLIAQAFQSIDYPILPTVTTYKYCSVETRQYIERDSHFVRHHSLYAPRDFDLSPYFSIIKPTIEEGFHYQDLSWDHSSRTLLSQGIEET